MSDISDCRMFILNRFYFDFKHNLIKENEKLVKDTYYNGFNQLSKICYFHYNYDTPDYKIIKEVIYDKYTNERRTIDYKVDYKRKTERHIHKDGFYTYLDLKYFFVEIDGKLELLRVNEYSKDRIRGCHFYRDVNKVKLNRSLYIPVDDIPKAMKLTKEEFERYTRSIPYHKLRRKDCDL